MTDFNNTIPCWWLNNKYFEPYVYVEDAFTDSECDSIKEYCDKLNIENATISEDKITNNEIRQNNIAWLNNYDETTKFLYEKLTDYANTINDKFWQFNLEYLSTLQFTKYSAIGDKYCNHLDLTIPNSYEYRKLSFSLQLDDEDDYEGCDLIISLGDNEKISTKRKKGTINFFPSFMMHQVTPLLKGERNCIVGWICGPRFK